VAVLVRSLPLLLPPKSTLEKELEGARINFLAPFCFWSYNVLKGTNMANYPLMIYYFSTVDKDIQILEKHPGSKLIVKQLIKLQEYTRAAWAKIHSIVKTMQDTTPETAFEKSQDVVNLCFEMNLKINVFYDKIVDIAVKKKETKNGSFLLDYALEELYYGYSIYLDALHLMGIYYIPSNSFPFMLADLFANRKLKELSDKIPDEEEP
jgi:hypothetical protein